MADTVPVIDLRRDILRTCFEPFEGVHLDGSTSNSKIDLGKLPRYHELTAVTASQIAARIRRYDADLLISVSEGANWLSREAAMALGKAAVLLRTDVETQEISFSHNITALTDAACVVLLEDILNSGRHITRTLADPWVGERAVAVVAVWDRGDADARPAFGVPVMSLVQERVPDVLPSTSGYWEYVV